VERLGLGDNCEIVRHDLLPKDVWSFSQYARGEAKPRTKRRGYCLKRRLEKRSLKGQPASPYNISDLSLDRMKSGEIFKHCSLTIDSVVQPKRRKGRNRKSGIQRGSSWMLELLDERRTVDETRMVDERRIEDKAFNLPCTSLVLEILRKDDRWQGKQPEKTRCRVNN
jgi:hypothetical protein